MRCLGCLKCVTATEKVLCVMAVRNGKTDMPVIYRLAVAAKRFFPQGGITVHSLRSEARAGRLRLIRIANKDFVTEDAILEMVERCACRENENLPISGSGKEKAERQRGSFTTARSELAQAAAKRTLEGLKAFSGTISPKNSSPLVQVSRQGSRSPKSSTST